MTHRCVERGYVTRVVQGGSLCIMVPRFGLETAVKLDDAKAFSFVSSEMKLVHKRSDLECVLHISTRPLIFLHQKTCSKTCLLVTHVSLAGIECLMQWS